jgi:hypothetical protein
MSALPKVAIVILTWNRREDVLRCVASLARLEYANRVPLVVDNASEDGTVDALRARYPDLTVLRNDTNRGYAGGNNAGMAWALAAGADYVHFLNSDSEVTPTMLSELVRVAEADPSIGVVGCRNLLLDDPNRLWGAYGVITFGPFLVRTAGERAADGPQWHVVRDVDFAIGNGYLWRRSALERVGGLDESFFGYHEDADWCVRARAAGYRVVYAGTAAVLHKGGSSGDVRQPRSRPASYFLGRNGIAFARKHAAWHARGRLTLLSAAAWGARGARALVWMGMGPTPAIRERGRMAWRAEAWFIRGMMDALGNRPIPFVELGLPDAVTPPTPDAREAG